MGKRSQSQEIDHHHLAVVVPSIGQKAEFGSPPMRQQRGVLGQPTPINPVKDLVSQKTDFRMSLEVLPASENSAQQDGSVDRRNFRIPYPLSGVEVGEMVKESPMSRHLFPQEAQSRQHPIPRIGK